MVEDKTLSGRLFQIVNFTLLAIIALVTVLPFLHVVAGSFTTSAEMAVKKFILVPTIWSLDAYKFIFSTDTIFRAMAVSSGVTLFGTAFSMFTTALMAYGLSRRDLDGRKAIMFLVVFTMLFSGGLIPTFLVVKEMGLINSYAALVIPSAISAFNLIIMKNFFKIFRKGWRNRLKLMGATISAFCSGSCCRFRCPRLRRFPYSTQLRIGTRI